MELERGIEREKIFDSDIEKRLKVVKRKGAFDGKGDKGEVRAEPDRVSSYRRGEDGHI